MSKICSELHRMINQLPRFKFPFDDRKLPSDGIYFLFENGEVAHGTSRIVRIGSHTGEGRLVSRLNEHFIEENKDRSIFRKNIGRALLNKNHDPFLDQWELKLTSRVEKEENWHRVDHNKKEIVEKQVTQYIQDNFWFVILPIKDKDLRLKLEFRIVSTISYCDVCKPSANWLGLFSPKDKIRKSGLWQVNSLYKKPFTTSEYEIFSNNFSKK